MISEIIKNQKEVIEKATDSFMTVAAQLNDLEVKINFLGKYMESIIEQDNINDSTTNLGKLMQECQIFLDCLDCSKNFLSQAMLVKVGSCSMFFVLRPMLHGLVEFFASALFACTSSWLAMDGMSIADKLSKRFDRIVLWLLSRDEQIKKK